MASESPLAKTGFLNMARTRMDLIFETQAIPADREKFPGTVDMPIIGRLVDPIDRVQRLAVTTEVYKNYGYVSSDLTKDNYLPGVTVDIPFDEMVNMYPTSPMLLHYLRSRGASERAFDSYLFGDGLMLKSSAPNAETQELFFDRYFFHSTEYGVRIDGQIVASARVIDADQSPTLANEKLRNNINPDLLDAALASGGEISQFARLKDFDKKGMFLPWLIKAIFVDSKRRGINTLTMNIDGGLQKYLNGIFSILGTNEPPGLIKLGEPVMHLGSMTTSWLQNIQNTESLLATNINYFRDRLKNELNQTPQRTVQLEQQVMLCLLLGGFEHGIPSLTPPE